MIFDIDNWKEIGATLARNKTRTFLTAFGIFWGTAMLALLWGGAQGLKQALVSNFQGFATNSAAIFPGRTSMPYKGYQKGMSWLLTTNDVDNIRRLVPEFEVISPIASSQTTAKHKDKSFAASLLCLEPNYADVMNPTIIDGRFISEADLSNSAKVCVIGQNVANKLYADMDPIGQFVEADNVFYRVVGIAKQKSEINLNGRIDDAMIIPLSTGRRAYNMGDKIHYIMAIAKDGYSPTDLMPRVYRAVRLNHPLHPDDKTALDYFDISQEFKNVDNIFTGVDVLILFVGLSSLIAGIIGVGNIMWIIVKERTKEFGIRRALGAKPREVMSQILSESAVLTGIAGTAGICFAVGVLSIASKIASTAAESEMDFQLSFSGALIIMAAFLILGCLAGTIPAIKAMRIKPIEALNDK